MISSINPAAKPHIHVTNKIIMLSFMLRLTRKRINMPLPALTNNPAQTAGNVITLSRYIVVNNIEDAQLGIIPTREETRTDLFG